MNSIEFKEEDMFIDLGSGKVVVFSGFSIVMSM